MSSLFLFGAGASFGCGPCYPYNPPLGRDLFRRLQEQGGIAACLPDDVARALSENPERGMERMPETQLRHVPALLRQMATYLVEFCPRPGNLYAQLLDVLGNARFKSVFATLNYDLLLERAIGGHGHLVIHNLGALPNTIPVLKLHGSCGFLPDLMGGRFVNCRIGNPEVAIVDGDSIPVTTTQEVVDFCQAQDRDNSPMAPIMALYVQGKRVHHCPSRVRQQQASWREALSVAARIFVIGVAVNEEDTHVWGAMAEASAPMYYVGLEPETFADWADAKRMRPRKSYVIARTFAEALPAITRRLRG